MMAVQNSTTVAVVRMDENSSKLLDAIFVLLRAFLGRWGNRTMPCDWSAC
jgi:hypothetical protein